MMFFHSIIFIISFLFAGNTRAAATDNCVKVKDITNKYDVNHYNNPYYNDKDENVYYSFNVSASEASDKSHISILYKRSNKFGYDSILVIVFADCPEPVNKCGMLDFGLYRGQWRDTSEMEIDNQYRQKPSKVSEIVKYYSIDMSERQFVARYLTLNDAKGYTGTFNVFIIPAVMNKTDADKFKDHFCPTSIKLSLYIPCGDYSALRHTEFYEMELKKCDGTTTTKPITTASESWPYMEKGSDIGVLGPNGSQYKGKFYLDSNNTEIRLKPQSERNETRISVKKLHQVRSTDFKDERVFSIIYGDELKRLDVNASTSNEASIWVAGLTFCMLTGKENKEGTTITKPISTASDYLRYMQQGSDLVELGPDGNRYKLNLYLDSNMSGIRWGPLSKKNETRILLKDVQKVRTGKITKQLRKYAAYFPDDCVFSVMYGGDHYHLDVIASTSDEAFNWVTGLSYCMLNEKENKKISPTWNEECRDKGAILIIFEFIYLAFICVYIIYNCHCFCNHRKFFYRLCTSWKCCECPCSKGNAASSQEQGISLLDKQEEGTTITKPITTENTTDENAVINFYFINAKVSWSFNVIVLISSVLMLCWDISSFFCTLTTFCNDINCHIKNTKYFNKETTSQVETATYILVIGSVLIKLFFYWLCTLWKCRKCPCSKGKRTTTTKPITTEGTTTTKPITTEGTTTRKPITTEGTTTTKPITTDFSSEAAFEEPSDKSTHPRA